MSSNMRCAAELRQLVGQQDLQVTDRALLRVIAAGIAIQLRAPLGDMHTKWLSSCSRECNGVSARTYSTLPRRPASLSPQ